MQAGECGSGLSRWGLLVFALAAMPFGSTACTPSSADAGQLQVVTTGNIVGDWTMQIVGERAQVFSLQPANSDPHSYRPGPREVARVADADLVLSIGLNLEATWLDGLIKNAAADPSRVVALGESVNPMTFVDGPEHGVEDPHFWFDPLRVKLAVSEIAARLSALDPGAAESYRSSAQAYRNELDELHTWIQAQISQIPPERRVLMTSHDNLGYFAQRYGLTIAGTVMPGTTEREPSAQELRDLARQLRQLDAPAIFTEAAVNDRLARRIAEEADVTVVRSLYTDSLGPSGSGADSYIGMMRTNVATIVEALK